MSDTSLTDSGFRLKGHHVLLMLVAFFGVVFAVNAYMMKVAMATFSGVESATPYKDGLAYNSQIAEAKRQAELGWTVTGHVERNAEGVARVNLDARDAQGLGLAGVVARATLERPADKREDRTAELRELGGGRFAAQVDGVAPGQWDLVIEILRDDQRVFKSRSRITLR
ncbi:nitrogen fixation protein FixH [Alsobacter soli]|uniref:Nitrogen fixation protein FixH n=1 Tax=Alsobacter soli TaxID=2109933 RepID=A0A2T1HYU3_9HYPH|nr:FixH family protein [Alsobacter soli]PSC06863.1 nitrogen fixation protein FixH [Alsobacter soli]